VVANFRPIQPAKIDPAKEYAVGGQLVAFPYRTLPRQIDDLERELGTDTYDRMMRDPKVAAAVWQLINGALADGVQVAACITEETEQGFELATEIAEFCERNLKRLQRPIRETLEMLLEAIPHGHKVAEQVYEYPVIGPDTDKLCLKALKVKPLEATAFVVDRFMNVLGLVYAKQSGFSMNSLPSASDILPREKFALLTLRPKDEDPRGQSWLRPAYTPWNMKFLNVPEYLLFLMRCACPGLVGILPENASSEEKRDESGNIEYDASNNPITITAAQAMLNTLMQFRNNTASAFPNGADVKPLEVESEGEPFLKSFEYFDSQIMTAILFNELSSSDSSHQTKNATESQAGITEQITWYLKGCIAQMICNDIFKPLVRYNFGEEIADQYLPHCSLGDSSRKDWASDGEAFGNFAKYLKPSERDQVVTQLGIQPGEPDEQLLGDTIAPTQPDKGDENDE
jgi:hypothetical protein